MVPLECLMFTYLFKNGWCMPVGCLSPWVPYCSHGASVYILWKTYRSSRSLWISWSHSQFHLHRMADEFSPVLGQPCYHWDASSWNAPSATPPVLHAMNIHSNTRGKEKLNFETFWKWDKSLGWTLRKWGSEGSTNIVGTCSVGTGYDC